MQRYTMAAVLAVLLAGAGVTEAHGQGRRAGGEREQKARAEQRGQPDRAQAQQRGRAAEQRARPEQGRDGKQSRARDQGRAQSADPGQRGQGRAGRANADRGGANAAVRRVSRPARLDRLPDRWRPLAASGNPGRRAAAVAFARGAEFGSLPVTFALVDDRIRLLNDDDELLLDLTDDEARRLGYWDVRRLDPDGVREGAPAFCRSGAGHPVWGREWCIDKGFGLGASDDWRWGRHSPDDVFFETDIERDVLDSGDLIDVLGAIVFDRLALHALTLGLSEPLAARWLGEATGPRVMLIRSGERDVAEMVDLDRDGRVDVMYVTSR